MRGLLRSHRGYLVLSIFVLGVSTGLNLLVFTVVNALWLRPLPYPDAEQVVTLPGLAFGSLDNLRALRLFEGGVAGQVVVGDQFGGPRPQIEISEIQRDLEILGVTHDYFSVLRLPVKGRGFTIGDEQAGAEAVAIISDRLWSHNFGGRSEVIGAMMSSRPVPIRVVGVAPPGFSGVRRGERVDVWIPVNLASRVASTQYPLMLLARLGMGQTVTNVTPRLIDALPPARQVPLTPLPHVFGTQESPTTLISEQQSALVVSGLAMLVLLAGCATLAALVLLHYERRRGELALRMALGADRGRMIFEMSRDLLLVGTAGSVAGLIVATVGVHVMPGLTLPGGVNLGRLDFSVDWRVVAIEIAVAVLTLVAAAVVPLARATRPRLAGELLTGSSATTLASLRVRQGLLAFQVCSTIVVLVSAGLLVRSVLNGFGPAAGFDVEKTVFVTVNERPLPRNPDLDPFALIAKRNAQLAIDIANVPGVIDVAEGSAPIGDRATFVRSMVFQVREQLSEIVAGVLTGSPDLLSVLGVPLIAGRSLTASDAAPTPRPVVVTRSLAARLWPDGESLNRVFFVQGRLGGQFQVVGIAGDLALGSLTTHGSGVVVSVASGRTWTLANFVVRTDHPESVARLIPQMINAHQVRATTGRQVIAVDIGRQRLGAWFFSGFGLAALLLGVGGVFGLVAYVAESQRRELGVRMALGAGASDLIRHAMVAGLVPASAGVVAGLALAGLAAQVLSKVLVGISPLDPVTYVVTATLILSLAAGAGVAAAWRLRRANPSDALRAG